MLDRLFAKEPVLLREAGDDLEHEMQLTQIVNIAADAERIEEVHKSPELSRIPAFGPLSCNGEKVHRLRLIS